MKLTDISYITRLLSRHGVTFSKKLGQNFLCDSEVPPYIAENAGIDKDTCVLEIGPGIGTLTVELLERSFKTVCVELDRRLLPVLQESLAGFENAAVIQGDILKIDLQSLAADHFENKRAVVCANLPYYITTPVITALIESGLFESITVMVQREVAHRICAKPATPDFGAFTLYINYHARASYVLDVPKESFIPSPKVDSAVVRLDVLKSAPVAGDKGKIFKLIKAAFAQRRKTLLNALGALNEKSRDEIIGILKAAGIDEKARGETLGLEDFARIADCW